MYPVLFHLGSLPVPTHDFFTVLGLLVATAVVLIESRHRGMADRAMATIAAGGLLGAAIGARLGNWWVYLTGGGELTLPGLLVDSWQERPGRPDRGVRRDPGDQAADRVRRARPATSLRRRPRSASRSGGSAAS